MTVLKQRSFAGGEIAPSVQGRDDQQKYAAGLDTCRNFFVQRQGAISNRAGFEYITEAYDGSNPVRLIRFVFNNESSYAVELGDNYLRIIQDGELLSYPEEEFYNAGEYYPTNWVVLYAGTYYSSLIDLNNGNQPDISPSEWRPLTGPNVLLDTPYASEDLFQLHYAQSADVLTLVHPSYPPYDLTRNINVRQGSLGGIVSQQYWLFTEREFQKVQQPPTAVTSTFGAASTKTYCYAVTAIAGDTGQESYLATATTAAFTITSATQTNPVVVTTSAAHNLVTGDPVLITGSDVTELNGRQFETKVLTGTTFELVGIDGAGFVAPATTGSMQHLWIRSTTATDPSTSAPHVISWTSAAGAARYNIYQQVSGQFQYIGTAIGESFSNGGIEPDAGASPPDYIDAFLGDGNYPSTIAYHQQRLCLANTNNDVERVWMSQIGRYSDFSSAFPTLDDDSLNFQLAGLNVNEVQALVPLNALAILTTGGEWSMTGDQDGTIRPSTLVARQVSYNGSSTIQPLIINNHALYVQSRQSVIRSLAFDSGSLTFASTDLSIFADHLFNNFTIVDWAWQQVPNSIVWAVRNDGKLAALTYIPDHEIWAWHQHDTDGEIESVVAVPEGAEDRLYAVIKRTINGSDVRYIERMAVRNFTDVRVDAVFVDSFRSYDGNYVIEPPYIVNLTVTGGTNWTYDETLTLTNSGFGSNIYQASDVGTQFIIRSGDDSVALNVVAYISSSQLSVQPTATVPASLRGVSTTDWAHAINEITGLDHLEGKQVSILADGAVIDPITVSGGSITLPYNASVVHAGLPYTSTAKTLPLEVPGPRSLIDDKKLINRAIVDVYQTIGISAGTDEDGLSEFVNREWEDEYDTIAPKTGRFETVVLSAHDYTGQLIIQQSDPLPATIRGIAFNVE